MAERNTDKRTSAEIQTVRSRVVYNNRWMSVREDEIMRSDGSTGVYGVVDKTDFVLIVPFDGERLYLVEQFRYPMGRRCCEFPQGSWELNPEADPIEVARGELLEETGLEADKLQSVGYLHTSPGFCSQGCYVYYATVLSYIGRSIAPEEVGLEVVTMTPAEYESRVLDGKIGDSNSIAAYAMVTLLLGKLDT